MSPGPQADATPRRLLFLPGAGADPDFWRPLGSRLPGEWHKTYFGWPGLGHQPPSPAIRGFDDLVAMVVAELSEKPVDLLAQSMGGAIALRVALDHPQRVRRLVLAVTAGGLDVAALGGADWRPELNPASLEVISAAWLEPSLLAHAPETSVQFERLGYFIADWKDHKAGATPIFNRTVTLRDSWAKEKGGS